MNPLLLEAITKAANTADFLANDIRDAHRLACMEDPFLEILLRDHITAAAKIKLRMEELHSAANAIS